MVKVNDIEKFIKDHDITKIFLDCDGVIMASCQAIVDMLNKEYGTEFKGEEVTSWNFNNLIPYLTENDIEGMFEGALFFDLVRPIEGVIDFIKRHEKDIIIVTKSSAKNLYFKRIWFDKYNLNIPIISVPLELDKTYIDMRPFDEFNTLFIDDSTINLWDSNATYTIQFREYLDDRYREWQNDWQGMVMYSWK